MSGNPWSMFFVAGALAACDASHTGSAGSDAEPEVAPDVAVTSETETTLGAIDVPDEVAPDTKLADGLYRIRSLDPGEPPDDLDPLFAMVESADWFGLGESIHTSGGFYAAKRRLIQALVEFHGLRVLAMETPRAGAKNLAAFIDGGECQIDATTMFKYPTIFLVFVDDHTEALFRWLCEWNAAHPADRVTFFGFDAQQPDVDYADLLAFYARRLPDRSAAVEAALSPCLKVYDLPEDDPPEHHPACLEALDAIADEVATLELPESERVDMEVTLVSFRSWQIEALNRGFSLSVGYEARDIAMARIFELLVARDHPGERIAIWAHNYHLAADHPHIVVAQMPGTRTFGSELRARHGRTYQAIALTAYRPGINWPSVGDGPTDQGSQDDAIEGYLYSMDEPYLAYDPRATFLDPDELWHLSEEQMIMRANFDGIMFVRDSPPMDALAW